LQSFGLIASSSYLVKQWYTISQTLFGLFST